MMMLNHYLKQQCEKTLNWKSTTDSAYYSIKVYFRYDLTHSIPLKRAQKGRNATRKRWYM